MKSREAAVAELPLNRAFGKTSWGFRIINGGLTDARSNSYRMGFIQELL